MSLFAKWRCTPFVSPALKFPSGRVKKTLDVSVGTFLSGLNRRFFLGGGVWNHPSAAAGGVSLDATAAAFLTPWRWPGAESRSAGCSVRYLRMPAAACLITPSSPTPPLLSHHLLTSCHSAFLHHRCSPFFLSLFFPFPHSNPSLLLSVCPRYSQLLRSLPS